MAVYLLQNPVNKKYVADYNKFVPPEKEMWVKKINIKLTRSQYTSRTDFQKDVNQIAKNARAYNLHPEAVCANPSTFCSSLHAFCSVFAGR